MTIVIDSIDLDVADSGDGDDFRPGAVKLETSLQNLKAAGEDLQGRWWSTRDSSLNPAVLGKRYLCDAHSGITFTLPATFAESDTAYDDIWISSADNASAVTITPASGDAIYIQGITLGVDTSYVLARGNTAILAPRTDDSEWNLILITGQDWTDSSADLKTSGDIYADRIIAGNPTLTTDDQFYMAAGSATVPVLSFDAQDYIGYDRTANQYQFTIGGTSQLIISASLIDCEDNTLQFGGHSAVGAETVTGYITINDSGGTPRKLAVIS